MFRLIYTVLLYLIQPIVWGYLYYRGRKNPAYRERWQERYAIYPKTFKRPQPNGIIIHAVSVGETVAAAHLIRAILTQYPTLPVTVTSITPTGSERVRQLFGEQVSHCYLPYDLPDAMARFIAMVQPKLCVVIETEIWANLIHQLHKHHIPFIIANARLSARSYQRYAKFRRPLQAVLNEIGQVVAQDQVSAERYLQLGYPASRIVVTGNLKYDLTHHAQLASQITELRQQWQLSQQDRQVWIAASTHQGEDEIILQAHRTLLRQYPNLLLLLVPRHLERFDSVAALLDKQKFTYIRRSTAQPLTSHHQVALIDTMGELMLMYGVSDIAFVAGSLLPIGGHNPLEPLSCQCPVITGQYTFNFPDVYAQLLALNGVVVVESRAEEIANVVKKWLDSVDLRERYAKAGYQVLQQNQGALQRLMQLLAPYIDK